MKTSYSQQKVLKRAIDTFGIDKQKLMVIEELSELQKAIIKHMRKPCQENVSNIAEEVADVYIMLRQLDIMFGIDTEVEKYIDFKVKRLSDRINEFIKNKKEQTNDKCRF